MRSGGAKETQERGKRRVLCQDKFGQIVLLLVFGRDDVAPGLNCNCCKFVQEIGQPNDQTMSEISGQGLGTFRRGDLSLNLQLPVDKLDDEILFGDITDGRWSV